MIYFVNFQGERRTDLLYRAIGLGITSLPRRDFQQGGRLTISFEVKHG